MKRSKKYQVGGDTDFFNQLVDAYANQYQSQESDSQAPQYEDVPQTNEDNTDYQDLQERYDNLQSQFEELSSKISGFTNQTFQDDSFLNFLFSDSDNKMPLDFSHESEPPEPYSASRNSGLNPNLIHSNTDIFGKYNVTNLGAWGDKAHQARKSEHNTGDAQDYGVSDPETAQNVIAELQKNPKTKYIIYNKQIWNPSISNEWRPYTGSNPHSTHVHASFNRQYGGGEIPNPGYGQLDDTETTEYTLRHADKLKVHKNGDFKGLIPLDVWNDDMMNYIKKFKFVKKDGERFIKVKGSLNTPSTNSPMPIISSPQALQEGLNNPYYAQFGQLQMDLPQHYNVIRGLDNGTPVRVEDELGQSAVLHGKNHKKYFFGKVKEQML